MRWMARIRMRLRTLFGRKAEERRLEDELDFHLQRQIAENVAAGMNQDEARYAALRIFGNPTLLREQARASWSWNRLESFAQDLRYTVRALLRQPGFAATIVGTMALGIGSAAAMFTVVDHVLLTPVSYRDPSHLVVIQERDPTGKGVWDLPWLDVEEWHHAAHSFEGIALTRRMKGRSYLEGKNAALEVAGLEVSANLFPVLGARPLLGQGFVAEEPSFAQGKNANAIVLSYAAWQEGFGGDRGVVGKAVKINTTSYTVVGVMPAGFSYPATGMHAPEVWTGVTLDENDKGRNYSAMDFMVLARLAKGATVETAQSEMTVLQRRVAAEYTDPVVRKEHSVVQVQTYSSTLVEADMRTALLALLGASGVLWLIANLNATNLLLARNMARQRETAMRIALGASRLRVVQQMLVEGFALNGTAAALGIGLAVASVKILSRELSRNLPLPTPAMPDGWVLLALLGMTLLSTLVSTAWPAWLAARGPVEPGLKQGGLQAGTSRRQHRVRGVLVATEIAMSLSLLVVCGLLLRTIYTLRHVPLGYRTDHILVAKLSIPAFHYENKNVATVLYAPLLERMQHLHGVQNAGLISEVPLGNTFRVQLGLRQANHSMVSGLLKPVSPEIQQIFGFKMAAGRFFAKTDTPTSEPVAVVNAAFAKVYAPDKQDPASIVGSKFWSFKEGAETHIIGILDNQRQSKVNEESKPEVEICLCQITPDSGIYQPSTVAMDLAVRTERPTSEMIPELRDVLRQASPELGSATITTMDQIVEDSFGSQRLAAHLLEIFGGSALVLCMAGLYGLLAYVVSQRTRELGVRIALGARRGNLLWMVLRQAGVMLIAGLVMGTGLAFAAGKLVSRFLYGVTAHDAWTMAAAPALLLATGLLAAYIPARRAAHVDPMEALRAE
jgi:putative ABC transport system permease protein